MGSQFLTIDYLKRGTPRQRQAYDALTKLEIFDFLKEYNPLLAGTIPLDIDIISSDLDILCNAKDLCDFTDIMEMQYGKFNDFQSWETTKTSELSVLSSFQYSGFTFEIFCQSKPSHQQNAFIHMLVEDRLLKLAHPQAKDKIRTLKLAGVKTEPAFAQIFEISGDPYEGLLNLQHSSDGELTRIAQRWNPPLEKN